MQGSTSEGYGEANSCRRGSGGKLREAINERPVTGFGYGDFIGPHFMGFGGSPVVGPFGGSRRGNHLAVGHSKSQPPKSKSNLKSWKCNFVTSDLDIYRTTNLLIQQHGDDAPIHAAMRADKLMEAGDMEGKAVWKRILAAIDELLAEKRPDGVGVH